MNYKKQDFAACQFNPLTDDTLTTEYPVLCSIVDPEWNDDHTDSILRYIIMVYDPKSPLVNNERDLNYRKDIAGDLSGIEEEDLRVAVFKSTHDYSPDLTIKYLMRFAKNKEWAAICAFESSFWESIKEVIEPISGKNSKEKLESVQKKAAIKEEIEKDIKRLDALYRSFFGEDDELQNKAKRRLSPEAIADRR